MARIAELVTLLDQSTADDLEHSKILQQALRAFIERVPRERVPGDVQLAIHKWTKPKVSKASAPSAIQSFFVEKRRLEGKGKGKRKKDKNNVGDLIEAVHVLEVGSRLPPTHFEEIWADQQLKEPFGSRQHCLMTTGASLEKGSLLAEVARRIVQILVYDNIEDLTEVCEPTYVPGKPNTALNAAIDHFVRASGWDDEAVRTARLEGAGYLALMKHFGVGVVLLTGSGKQSFWTRISKESSKWLHDYCFKHSDEVTTEATRLNALMSSIIPKSICQTRGSVAEFQRSKTTLRDYFVRDCGQHADLGMRTGSLPRLSRTANHEITPHFDPTAAAQAAAAALTNLCGQSNQQISLPGRPTGEPYDGLAGNQAAAARVNEQDHPQQQLTNTVALDNAIDLNHDGIGHAGLAVEAAAALTNLSGPSCQRASRPSLTTTLEPNEGLYMDNATSTQIRASNSRSDSVSGLNNDSRSVNYDQTSALQRNTDAQIAQQPWQASMDLNCPPSSTAHNFLSHGAETAQTYQFDQTVVGNLSGQMSFTNGDTVSNYWPVEWFGQFEENFEA